EGESSTDKESSPPPAPAPPALPTETPAPGTTTPPKELVPAAELPATPATPPSPADALSTEEKEGAIRDLGIKMDDLWTRIYENDGNDFEQFARDGGFEVQSTDLYTRDSAPEDLKEPLRDAPGKLAVDATFERDKGTSPADALSDIRRVGEDKWFLFRIDDAVEPKELTFEEARERARTDLARERALEAMTEAAEQARTAVAEAMKAGKSFEDAAKEQDLTFLKYDDVTVSKPVPGEPLAQEVFDIAAKVDPGSLSDVSTQINEQNGVHRAIFLFVEKRELVDSPTYQSMLEQSYRRAGDTLRQLALQNWFAQQYAAAEVRFPSS
ncbi:MAG: hypothetical protein HKO57_05235, partial [Akkermansiaceae bacterium]|nr:hypothetical protein [Akkermansiaceae bacterium]